MDEYIKGYFDYINILINNMENFDVLDRESKLELLLNENFSELYNGYKKDYSKKWNKIRDSFVELYNDDCNLKKLHIIINKINKLQDYSFKINEIICQKINKIE